MAFIVSIRECVGLFLLLTSYLKTCWTFEAPCKTQLGLKHGDHGIGVIFDISVSSGDANDVRLNGPNAWKPRDVTNSFVQINMSRPVLMTGLQIQGDNQLPDRITEWTLETSLDCEVYQSENYTVEFLNPSVTQTVALKSMEFVSCLRLKPTQYKGNSPALRLEFLGCVVTESGSCRQDIHPTTEIWLEGGGRQLNYDQEIVLVWVKVLLDLRVNRDIGDMGIFYSRSCNTWEYYEPLDMNMVSIISGDEKSLWMTLELDVPVKAKCLRLFPPLATKLSEVHTNACSTKVTSSLQELTFESQQVLEKDLHAKSHIPQQDLHHVDVSTDKKKALDENTSSSANLISKSSSNKGTDMTTPPSATVLNTVSTAKSQTYSFSISTDNVGEVKKTTKEPISNIDDENRILSSSEIAQSPSSNASKTSTVLENTDSKPLTAENSSTTDKKDKPSSLYLGEIDNISEVFQPIVDENTVQVEEEMSSNDTVIYMTDEQASQLPDNSTNFDGGFQTTEETLNNTGNLSQIWPDCGYMKSLKGARRKRVVGGLRNLQGEWPWLVSMHFLPENAFTKKSGFKHICGASIISPSWVLIAAHCFSDLVWEGLSDMKNWEVHVGLNDLAREDSQDSAQMRLISELFIYPEFNLSLSLSYDIALVLLDKPVEMNKMVSPVCLDLEGAFHEESECFVAGWGQLTSDSPGSRYSYSAPLTMMSHELCKEKYDKLPDGHEMKPWAQISESTLCASVGALGEDACNGDSGGPLMCEDDGRWYQAGVVSAGYECGHIDFPGLYSKVSYFGSWIKETIALHNANG